MQSFRVHFAVANHMKSFVGDMLWGFLFLLCFLPTVMNTSRWLAMFSAQLTIMHSQQISNS